MACSGRGVNQFGAEVDTQDPKWARFSVRGRISMSIFRQHIWAIFKRESKRLTDPLNVYHKNV